MQVFSHPCDDLLERYSIGSCSRTDAAQIQTHLCSCARCAERLIQLDHFVDLMKHTLGGPQDWPVPRMPPGSSESVR